MTKIPTIQELDSLRERSNKATEEYRKVIHDPYTSLLAGYERANAELNAHTEKCEAENAVLRALLLRWSCTPCPFGCGGILVPTSTSGRLACDNCSSVALVGKGCTPKDLI